MIGFDIADPRSGIFGVVRDRGATVLFDHEEAIATRPEGGAGITTSDGKETFSFSSEELSLHVEATRLGPIARLGGDGLPEAEHSVCGLAGELRRPGDNTRIDCLGVRTACDSDRSPRRGVQRSLAVSFGDGGMLVVGAARRAGEEGHGSERVEAVLAGPDREATPVAEALLSTQYDGEGRHHRAGVELWLGGDEDGPPLRAAGTIVSGTTIPLDGGRLDIAFFRWSMDGRPGLGRYEIVALD